VAALAADTVVLVVSHSDTVELIIEALGGGAIETIEDQQFDKPFVLFRAPASAARTPELGGPAAFILGKNFGAPTLLA
jgi:hypothetical protein